MDIALPGITGRPRHKLRPSLFRRKTRWQFPPLPYLAAFLCGLLPLSLLNKTRHVGSAVDPSLGLIMLVAGATTGIPWLYWYFRARHKIVIVWAVALWHSDVLIAETEFTLDQGHIHQGPYLIATGTALLGALITIYVRDVRRAYGWAALGAADQASIAALGLSVAVTDSVWLPHVHGLLARLVLSAYLAAIAIFAVLDIIGRCRREIEDLGRRVDAWHARRGRRGPVTRLVRWSAPPVLATYAAPSASVAAGLAFASLMWALPAWLVPTPASFDAYLVGAAVAALGLPVLFHGARRGDPASELKTGLLRWITTAPDDH